MRCSKVHSDLCIRVNGLLKVGPILTIFTDLFFDFSHFSLGKYHKGQEVGLFLADTFFLCRMRFRWMSPISVKFWLSIPKICRITTWKKSEMATCLLLIQTTDFIYGTEVVILSITIFQHTTLSCCIQEVCSKSKFLGASLLRLRKRCCLFWSPSTYAHI